MTRVRKAVIPAAGWGTRFLPATKAVPKEMLPIVDRPVIQRVIEEAVESGIEQIVIITASNKRAIEDHFDRSHDLEEVLKKKGDSYLWREVDRISHLADICYVRQKEQLGLGHAVLMAKRVIGPEPFAVLLPDDLLVATKPVTKQLIDVYCEYRDSTIAVQPVAAAEISSYGIIRPRSLSKRVYEITDLVEKPELPRAPSNLAVVGRYVLSPSVFAALEETRPGQGGEIQLTDALRLLMAQQRVIACEFEGHRYDVGVPLGYLKASITLALQHPSIGSQLRSFMFDVLGITDHGEVLGKRLAKEPIPLSEWVDDRQSAAS